MRLSAQFWTITLLFVATASLVHIRGDKDSVPPSTPLSAFPVSLGAWSSQEEPISQAALEVLGNGIFLSRVYTPGGANVSAAAAPGTEAPVGLFIAYFPTQRSGQSIHSPQNCLPGSGWSFESSGRAELVGAAGKKYQVAEYIISNGRQRQEVLYWYQSHGRTIANDYKAKLYMLADAIRYGRTDAALVRVITPIADKDDFQKSRERAVRFAEMITPLLPAYVPN